jgi:hypothetical protein
MKQQIRTRDVEPMNFQTRTSSLLGFLSFALLAGVSVCATSAMGQSGGPPTANGLFYGDGDHLRYPAQPFAVSQRGSRLFLTLINNTLYVAMVVDRTVNDNAFDAGGRTSYMTSAGWNQGGGNLNAQKRMDSEFAAFEFTVGEGTNLQTFSWQQGYGGPSNGTVDRRVANFIANETVSGGLGTPPPGMVSSSSLAWNLNRYAEQFAQGTLNWTMPGTDTNAASWKSPWVGADGSLPSNPNSVIDPAEGYPTTGQITFSPTYQWEWSMVYEWSVDMSQFGETPVFVVTGATHHSPAKNGGENDIFEPPSDPTPLSDFGDLPDFLYGTKLANNGAQHILDTGSILRMGASVDSEPNGQDASGLATDDDSSAINDDDGVTFPDNIGIDFVYRTTVVATNTDTSDALLCGWFDFANDGELTNSPNTSTTGGDPAAALATDAGERSCAVVPAGTVDGFFEIAWTIPESARENFGLLPFRYRISTDPAMFAAATLSSRGAYLGGEVEDYFLEFGPSTLPVSISAFDSRYTADGLEIRWTTVSETRNLGFHIWGDRGFGSEQLNAGMIPSESLDPTTPEHYRIVIPGIKRGEIEHLAVTAIDYSGDEEVYGMFEPGRNYGRKAAPAPIPWQEIKQQVDLRAQHVRAARKQQSSVAGFGNGSSRPDYVDLRVTTPGLQQVSWQMLADAGLDLNGVRPEHIAVTLKGEAVSRDIVGPAPTVGGKDARSSLIGSANDAGATADSSFGRDSVIRFWGEAPSIDDALYIEHYVYRISVDRSKVKTAARHVGVNARAVDHYMAWQRVDEQVRYHFAAPGADPWFAKLLRAGHDHSYTIGFDLDSQLLNSGNARIKVQLGGFTDYDTAPDHRAQVEVNGQVVADRYFDGINLEIIDAEVPASLLRVGHNTVRVVAPGGANAPHDLFVVDTVEIGYPRRLIAQQDRLLIEQFDARSAVQASGFRSDDMIAYAITETGLVRLSHRAAGSGTIIAPTLADSDARYWLSSVTAAAQPRVVTAGRNSNLLAGSTADFLIIAHPAFLPTSEQETHPLNDFIAQRRSDGWKVRTFDISEIQAEFGHGMALPNALTRFLAAADQRFRYEHVLLVGSDSYDYMDRLGHGSVSFIPTRYTRTRFIRHTPSDALLADLDGDGLADKAIGRWPVRSLADLQSIVTKTLDWPNIANPHSAVWVTDSEDATSGSFVDQAERMIGNLTIEGWNEDLIDRVYFGDVEPRPGQSIADSARMEFFDRLADGRALTGFVGHGAPSMWTFQGLLTPDDLSDLHNEGKPTLIGTMTCYTTYFVSPSGDTVAHRWMNGYREDAAGNAIPGIPNGAVAVHGAVVLSDYSQNEIFAGEVLTHQLTGQTLGRATLLARREASRRNMGDLVKNWTLLGDPTLRLH